jgi:acetyl esterase/lipase
MNRICIRLCIITVLALGFSSSVMCDVNPKAVEPIQIVATENAEESAVSKNKQLKPLPYPTCVRVVTNVDYLGADREEKADLYFPFEIPKSELLPVVLIIHGGGFNDGDKARSREFNFATNLVVNGYAAMSINYKLRKKTGDVTWPQSVYDAKTAVRWLRKNASELGIDGKNIGVMGGSAGGNLATMLATTGEKDGFDNIGAWPGYSSKVACAIDMYGAVDLMNYHDMKMFDKTRSEASELYIKASPITYVSPLSAPMLILHGTGDKTVAVSQSETLAAACRKFGVEHQLLIIDNAPHTFDLLPPGQDLRPVVFSFLNRHIKGRDESIQLFTNKEPILSGNDSFQIERDVSYLESGRTEKADLYLPSKNLTGRHPAVLMIHGGGWVNGDKNQARENNIGTNLAIHGIVGMSINYALSNHGQSVWPQNLYDCKTAVRWLRKNADRLQINPDQIGVIGGSAGGHLAAMVALTGNVETLNPHGPYGEYACDVRCCVDLYGISDLMTYHDVTMLGKTRAEDPVLYDFASPIHHITKNAPPFLIIHGDADTTVNVVQSKMLSDAMDKVGMRHHLVIVPGAAHTFHLQPKQRDLRPLVMDFFNENLKNKGSRAGFNSDSSIDHQTAIR